ncbi:carbohydrate ABC transporter permease [Paenibacillus piri]|uniref:Sugar ABC transporter permease n=1 Tax=Paenibacillus piri TaxID=2547395 RepID=A0A4R5KSR6_9BACL|nr:sugar ABC transporter permease [Paenibacillus piri]TDF98851.1 sugar ABC transporter permease [Paenibacillus piri]
MEGRSQPRDKAAWLALPGIVIVALVTQIPFIATIVLSFVRWIVIRPDQGIHFNGVQNYIQIFQSKDTYSVIVTTVIIMLASLLFCTVLGTCLAIMLNRDFPGVNVVRTLVILPFFVMDAVAGIIWKTLILNPSFGFNYYIAGWFNLTPVDFFGPGSLLTVIMLIVWQWTPFFFLIILAGFQGISADLVESAKVDGANAWRRLVSIELPAIMNHLQVAVMLGLIFILKVFGLIYVTTTGGPGVTSSNLPFYSYRLAFNGWNVGNSAVLSVISVALTLFIITMFFKFMKRRMEGAV